MKQAVSVTQLHKAPSRMLDGNGLLRPCPCCGNSDVGKCELWCASPEFKVFHCCECDARFINAVIDDNVGFSSESAVEPDAMQVEKAKEDFANLQRVLRRTEWSDALHVSLLDVGCSTGTFLQEARTAGWRVAGLELSPSVADYARKSNNLEIRQEAIDRGTELETGRFDIVTLFGVIEHLAFPQAAMNECARLLKKDGILVLQTPSEDGLMRRAGRILYKVSGGGIDFHVKQLYQTHGGHSVCFTRRCMKQLLQTSGFETLLFEPSTYGFRMLLLRFRRFPLWMRVIYGAGTGMLFLLGEILGGSNHFTVYARKLESGPIGQEL